MFGEGWRVFLSLFYSFRRRSDMRLTAGCMWKDHKTNTDIAKQLVMTTVLDKVQNYKRNRIQHVNRMPGNKVPKLMKNYTSEGRN